MFFYGLLMIFPSFHKITAIDLGFFNIKVWGLFVALSMIAAFFVTYKEAKRKKINKNLMNDLFIWVFIASIIGGRLFYIFLHFSYFRLHPSNIFYLWDGGMFFYGAVFVALLTSFFILRKQKISFWKIFDMACPGLTFALSIGYFGSWIALDSHFKSSLYFAINSFIFFLILVFFLNQYFKKNGQLSVIFITWYLISRFSLGFLMFNNLSHPLVEPRMFGLTLSQYLSFLLFVGFIPWGIRTFFRPS